MNKTLEKIDEYINKMDKKKKMKKNDKLPFLYKTEDIDELGLDCDVKERLMEAGRKVGGREYDKFFTSMLKKWKINSYKDLSKAKQKKFFDEVDKKWNAKKETD